MPLQLKGRGRNLCPILHLHLEQTARGKENTKKKITQRIKPTTRARACVCFPGMLVMSPEQNGKRHAHFRSYKHRARGLTGNDTCCLINGHTVLQSIRKKLQEIEMSLNIG